MPNFVLHEVKIYLKVELLNYFASNYMIRALQLCNWINENSAGTYPNIINGNELVLCATISLGRSKWIW